MGSTAAEPKIDRSVSLDLVGDWGQATFHKILSWVTQEFCNRAGPQSRTKIWSIRGGGSEAVPIVHSGEADLCVATPAGLMAGALKGEEIFKQYGAMPHLRALAVLPQRDRMVLAVHPDVGVKSFADIREKKPALKIAQSGDDGSSFIGYVSTQILAAHGVTDAALQSWGGEKVAGTIPTDCLDDALNGKANAVIQEAIMLPHWGELIEKHGWIPIPFEAQVLEEIASRPGFKGVKLERNFWSTTPEEVQALDFADFVITVRDDMADDVAELLTWCLVHTRKTFEKQFLHIPPEKCSLTYPMEPSAMAKTPIQLHPGAKKVYVELGIFT